MEEINPKENIVEEYFRLFNIYSKRYSKDNTILFLQVGSFFEAYATLDDGFNLHKISDVLNILVSKKNKSILEVSLKNPYMLGFPIITIDKYVKILIDNNYTVVIGEQITQPPYPKRKITQILSPGTYIETTQPDVNNILSIYIENLIPISAQITESIDISTPIQLIIGLSIIDLTTGKSIIYEVYSSKEDDKISLDEAVRFMHANQAKEIIITSKNIPNDRLQEIISYLEISDKFYNHQTITQLMNNGKKHIHSLSYQQELLKKVYPNTELLTPIEYLDLENLNFGRLSFIILLNYAYDHSHQIINNIAKPEIYQNMMYLNLANNAIFQLNLLTSNEEKSNKSLFDIINKTSTPMGRRMLKYNLTHPLINHKQITERYQIINQLMQNEIYIQIEEKLLTINDIERLNRKINLQIINPTDFYIWINSMSNCIDLLNYLLINNIKIENIDLKQILVDINNILFDIGQTFIVENLQKYLLSEIDGQIFRPTIYNDVDRLINKIHKCTNYMEALSWGLSNFLDKHLQIKKSSTTDDQNLIKIDQNDRDGHFLILTKRRADVLIQILEKTNKIDFEYNSIQYTINKDDLEFKHLPKGNNSKIFIKEMEKNSSCILEYETELKHLQKEYYIKYLAKLYTTHSKTINSISNVVSIIDFLKSWAKISIKNHYILPEIQSNCKSFINCTELRHPIIELINTNNEYIPIDIELGTSKQDGILLFGLNSAGKSSLQKSIGIAIIMAQMGYPVAAKQFRYCPYENLYTRISSNDNIYKGLSSFALEISELRAIIKRSNSNTLVIADEVCKGTEHKSSLIIVQTMLEILSTKKTSFITATHLHDLTAISRLKQIENIKMYHIHVEYNETTNTIRYDRKLKEGSGSNFYGLDVAKYLIADNHFMKLANEIKKDIFEIPDLLVDKLSNYNKDIYMDKCNICGLQPTKKEIPLETHHILFQKDFKNGINKNNFHIQKNHKSNLVVLCSKCHDMIDNNKINIIGWENNNKYDKLNYKLL